MSASTRGVLEKVLLNRMYARYQLRHRRVTTGPLTWARTPEGVWGYYYWQRVSR